MRKHPSHHGTRPTWLARATAILVTAAVLMTGPGIAQAAFTARTAGQVSASTLNLSSLTADSVSATCTKADELKIQLTTPVDRANYHEIAVKWLGFSLYTGELNAANNWTYQRSTVGINLNYAYEISAEYQVRVNGKTVNTWTGTALKGTKSC